MKLETANISIGEKNFKDLKIYYIRWVHSKSIKILILDYHELMENIKEHEEKNVWWLIIIC